MLTKQEIDIIINTLKPYNPKRIGLFGSVARNEEKKSSDIDILYSFDKPISLFIKFNIIEELRFKLHKEIDFVSENAVHPKLKSYIYNDLKIIYES